MDITKMVVLEFENYTLI